MIGAEEIFADEMIKLKHHLYIVKEIEPRVKSGVEKIVMSRRGADFLS